MLADPGAIGGDDTHEFMVLAETGEAEIVYCYRVRVRGQRRAGRGQTRPAEQRPTPESCPLRRRSGDPGVRTIAELEAFLDVPASSR